MIEISIGVIVFFLLIILGYNTYAGRKLSKLIKRTEKLVQDAEEALREVFDE